MNGRDFLNEIDADAGSLDEIISLDPDTSGPFGIDVSTDGDGDGDSDDAGASINIDATLKNALAISAQAHAREIAKTRQAQGKPVTVKDMTDMATAQALKASRKAAAEAALKNGTIRIAPRKTPAANGARKKIDFGLMPSSSYQSTNRETKDLRNETIAAFKRLHGNQATIEEPGYYYSTFEVPFNGDGTASMGGLTIASGTEFFCFTEAIGQTTTRLGNAYTVGVVDTDLQNPGTQTYTDQVFVIERVSMRVRGLRPQYRPSDLTGLTLSALQLDALSGKAMVWDDAGIMMPREIFHDEDAACLLAKELQAASTLSFQWNDSGIGGASMARNIPIGTYQEIPEFGSRNVDLTSGGAGSSVLDLPRGYIWTLNQAFQASTDSGGNGIFRGRLKTDSTIYYPINPIVVSDSGVALVPLAIGVYIELRLFGTSIRMRNKAKVGRNW
jgi:hypothetical protein